MDKEYGVVLDVDLTLFKAKMEEASLIAKKVSAETQGVTGNLNLNVDTSGIQSSLDGLKDKIVEIKEEFQKVNAQNIKNALSTNTGNQGLFSSLFFSNAKSGLGILKTIGTTLKIGLPIAIGIGLIGKIANYFKTKAEEAKKRIENLKQVFLNVFNAIGNGAKRVLSTAVGYIENFFNKALNSYMSFDQQLTKNIQNVWVGLGSFLAPILEYVVSLFQRLLAYINATIKVLTGVDFIAKANAKAMNGVASATAKAVKALAGFDELQNIERESGGGGGISGGGIEIPDVDTSNIESFAKKIKEMIDQDNWEGIGLSIRDKIIDALNSIPWAEIQIKAGEIGRKLAEFLNGLMKPQEDGTTLGGKLGETLANAINTAIAFLYNFLKTLNLADVAKNIVDAITTAIENINWEELVKTAQILADGILKLLKQAIKTFEEKAPEYMKKIKEFLEGPEGRKLLETIGNIIVKWSELKDTIKEWFEELVAYVIEQYKEAQKKIEAKKNAEKIIKEAEKYLEIPETSEIGKKNQATIKKRIENFRQNVQNMSSSEVNVLYNQLKRDLDKAKKGTDLETGLVDFNKVNDNIKNGFGNINSTTKNSIGNLKSTIKTEGDKVEKEATSKAENTVKKTSSKVKETIKTESISISALQYQSGRKESESHNEGANSVDTKATIEKKMQGVVDALTQGGDLASQIAHEVATTCWTSYNTGSDSVDTKTPTEKKTSGIVDVLTKGLDIAGDVSKIFYGAGEASGDGYNKGLNDTKTISKTEDYFNKLNQTLTAPLDAGIKQTDASGKNMGSSLGLGIQTAFNGVIGGALQTVRNGLNNVIGLFNKSADNIGRNYNIKIKGSIANGASAGLNIAQDVVSNVIASVKKIPYLSIGTNEVYSEGLAYLHTGEKVVPANVAKGGYDSSDNKETNMLLRVLIDTLENKDFNATIGKDEVGRASVDYINKMKRITGGAIV